MGLSIDKAREIVNKFPNTPKKALAKLLYKENPALYKNDEAARTSIRTVTGACGKTKRKEHKQLAPQSPKGIDQPKITYNPYELQEQEHNDYRYYIIKPNKDTVVGIISDIHIPYQHNEALTAALDFLRKQKDLTHLIINGDLMDACQISKYQVDPNKRSFKLELDATRNFLKVLRKKFPTIKIVFKLGNHEKRYMTFMLSKAPELLGIEAFNLGVLLGLRELNIDMIPDWQLIQMGSMMIIHGHEFIRGFAPPVNAARGFFLKAKTNVIGGHHHSISSHSENRLDGKQIVAFSTGHLADEHPEYCPVNNWSHGFALIRHRMDGKEVNFIVNNYKIINGKIY